MKNQIVTKNRIYTILIILICLTLTACGGSGSAASGGVASGSGGSGGDGGDKSGGGTFETEYHDAAFHEDNAEGDSEVQVDLSCVSEGYFGVVANSDARLKLQVFKDSETYTYDIEQGTDQIFPLQCGDGTYTIKVMKNVGGSSYYELYVTTADVKLDDPFDPYLRPNAYADYSESSDCVKKAAEMAEESGSESDFVGKVYDYICQKVEYDYQEAKTVESGYVPDPDEVMETGKGICFDYASLAASMLRSQGVPTKIIFGYVAPDNLYHAWNMFYTEEKGWTTVEFSVDPGDWTRVDLTFSANGQNADFIGDGSNYQDVYQY